MRLPFQRDRPLYPSSESAVAVITGASSGIGAATAELFATRHAIRVLLVARRADKLTELSKRLPGSHALAVDLTDDDAPARVLAAVEEKFGRLDILVNNAGASWKAPFAEGGYANVRQNMELDFDSVLRLTETLLPLLRETPPSAIVNLTSVAGRVTRAGSGGYSAAKFALAGWTDALHLEEKAAGIHVGQVLPGFITTEGFPHTKIRNSRLTSWMISSPEAVAAAIADVAFKGRRERYVPRPYWLAAALRLLCPPIVFRALGRSNNRW